MMDKHLQGWCRPETILVVIDSSTGPARTLSVIRQIQASKAKKVLLVPVAQPRGPRWHTRSGRPFLMPRVGIRNSEELSDEASRTLLWAEVLGNITVLRSTPIEEIPSLAEELGVDRVVLASSGHLDSHGCGGDPVERALLTSTKVPLCFISRFMGGSSSDSEGIRRILLPLSLRSNTDLILRFSCELAQTNRAILTVLHVFDKSGLDGHHWQRTPVAVEAQLPITELRRDGIICPIEIAVSEGDPATAILNFDTKRQHDLIVMGGPSLAQTAKSSRNDVVHPVIAGTRCPVIVIGRLCEMESEVVGVEVPLALARTCSVGSD